MTWGNHSGSSPPLTRRQYAPDYLLSMIPPLLHSVNLLNMHPSVQALQKVPCLTLLALTVALIEIMSVDSPQVLLAQVLGYLLFLGRKHTTCLARELGHPLGKRGKRRECDC